MHVTTLGPWQLSHRWNECAQNLQGLALLTDRNLLGGTCEWTRCTTPAAPSHRRGGRRHRNRPLRAAATAPPRHACGGVPVPSQARAPRLSNSGCWLPDADAPCCHHQRSAQLFWWSVCRAGESPGNAAFPPGRRGPLPPEIPRASAFRPVDPAAPLPPNSVSTQESGAARTLGAPRGERSRLPP